MHKNLVWFSARRSLDSPCSVIQLLSSFVKRVDILQSIIASRKSQQLKVFDFKCKPVDTTPTLIQIQNLLLNKHPGMEGVFGLSIRNAIREKAGRKTRECLLEPWKNYDRWSLTSSTTHSSETVLNQQMEPMPNNFIWTLHFKNLKEIGYYCSSFIVTLLTS